MIKNIILGVRKNILTILKVVIVLIFIGGLLYWYEYRPIKIKQYCMKETVEKVKNASRATASTIRLLYWKCTIEKGL
jgi:uncharacterized protein YxeA